MTAAVADPCAAGRDALRQGRWRDAREAFTTALDRDETAEAAFGLASASWWLGEDRAGIRAATRAWVLYRRGGDVPGAVQSAVWLAITYKANLANHAAAGGWVARAGSLLAGAEVGCLHAWLWVARAYKLADLAQAEQLTGDALAVARRHGDTDLELVALAQLGLIRVSGGDPGGFGLLDEAMAGALSGEGASLDTVVYVCCDMLTACEAVLDLERAGQWCEVADDFVRRYGCPFLYAECRTAYGAVLLARGRWAEAEEQFGLALRATVDTCPALHARAQVRLAELRVGQGRWEEAGSLLDGVSGWRGVQVEADRCRARLALAGGDGDGAVRLLQREDRDAPLGAGPDDLALLIDGHLLSGRADRAAPLVHQLSDLTDRPGAPSDGGALEAAAAGARGRLALAQGDRDRARRELQAAAQAWARAGRPREEALAASELAQSLAPDDPATAIGHARRALASLERIGAARDADRVAALLRSLGVVPRTGARAGRFGAHLTAREREVLELVRLGLSNPEIARRLHVSRKTAAHHVSNILSKLGVRNRAEAAARAAALASPPPDRP